MQKSKYALTSSEAITPPCETLAAHSSRDDGSNTFRSYAHPQTREGWSDTRNSRLREVDGKLGVRTKSSLVETTTLCHTLVGDAALFSTRPSKGSRNVLPAPDVVLRLRIQDIRLINTGGRCSRSKHAWEILGTHITEVPRNDTTRSTETAMFVGIVQPEPRPGRVEASPPYPTLPYPTHGS